MYQNWYVLLKVLVQIPVWFKILVKIDLELFSKLKVFEKVCCNSKLKVALELIFWRGLENNTESIGYSVNFIRTLSKKSGKIWRETLSIVTGFSH